MTRPVQGSFSSGFPESPVTQLPVPYISWLFQACTQQFEQRDTHLLPKPNLAQYALIPGYGTVLISQAVSTIEGTGLIDSSRDFLLAEAPCYTSAHSFSIRPAIDLKLHSQSSSF